MKDAELQHHPEGGRFKEVFRSAREVTVNGRKRSALTHIYFALQEGEYSRFHRVESDEIWNLYEGKRLLLHVFDPESIRLSTHELSPAKREYCFTVEAGLYQAAEPACGPVLAGCSVAPGFEFEDFTLLGEDSGEAELIREMYPEMKRFL